MTERQRTSSGAIWEPIIGYSRAVRIGSRVYVSGTTALGNDGEIVGVGDPYTQTVQALKNIKLALHHVGAGLQHIVRTRMFVTNLSAWQDYGRAHSEVLRHVMPATTMVEVSRLIDPRMMIEIEVDAEL